MVRSEVLCSADSNIKLATGVKLETKKIISVYSVERGKPFILSYN